MMSKWWISRISKRKKMIERLKNRFAFNGRKVCQTALRSLLKWSVMKAKCSQSFQSSSNNPPPSHQLHHQAKNLLLNCTFCWFILFYFCHFHCSLFFLHNFNFVCVQPVARRFQTLNILLESTRSHVESFKDIFDNLIIQLSNALQMMVTAWSGTFDTGPITIMWYMKR